MHFSLAQLVLCALLVSSVVSECRGQIVYGDDLSLSVFSDASCLVSYPGFDLTSQPAFGCSNYTPAVNPYSWGAVGASCSSTTNGSRVIYSANALYGAAIVNGGCGGGAHLYLFDQAQNASACLRATLYVYIYNINGTLTNATTTDVYATVACQQKNSAASVRSIAPSALGLSAGLLLAAMATLGLLVL